MALVGRAGDGRRRRGADDLERGSGRRPVALVVRLDSVVQERLDLRHPRRDRGDVRADQLESVEAATELLARGGVLAGQGQRREEGPVNLCPAEQARPLDHGSRCFGPGSHRRDSGRSEDDVVTRFAS